MHYLTTRSDCKNCPIRTQCLGKSYEKRIRITIWVEQYERNNEREEPVWPEDEKQVTIDS